VLVTALAARLPNLEADLPLAVERTNAPLLDAYWYLVAHLTAAGHAEAPDHPAYDRPLHTLVATPILWALGPTRTAAGLVGVVPGVLAVLLLLAARRALGPRVGALAGALSAGEQRDLEEACRTLAHLDDRGGAGALMAVLAAPAPSIDVKRTAAWALSRLAGTREAPLHPQFWARHFPKAAFEGSDS